MGGRPLSGLEHSMSKNDDGVLPQRSPLEEKNEVLHLHIDTEGQYVI
jgi:hypothetical protein